MLKYINIKKLDIIVYVITYVIPTERVKIWIKQLKCDINIKTFETRYYEVYRSHKNPKSFKKKKFPLRFLVTTNSFRIHVLSYLGRYAEITNGNSNE